MGIFRRFFSFVASLFKRKQVKALPPRRIVFSYARKFLCDEEADVYYSDDFFLGKPKAYNPSLATLSMAFSMASFSSNKIKEDFQKQAGNAVDFLKKCGFSEVEIPPYFLRESTPSGVAYALASKHIGDRKGFTLIAVGVRGANYGREWSSNFYVGEGDDHEGFALAAKKVKIAVEEYIASHPFKGEIRFWITGYSRGAAIANCLAHEIPSISLPKKMKLGGVYAYCFACPNLTQSSGDKDPIFNIINPSDIVPRMPFGSWGYRRYGTDIDFPSPKVGSYDSLLASTSSFREEDFGDPRRFELCSLDMAHILDKRRRIRKVDATPAHHKPDFLDELENQFAPNVTMAVYRSAYQKALCDVMALVDPRQENPYRTIGDFVSEVFHAAYEDIGALRLIGKVLSSKTDWEATLGPTISRCLEGKPYQIEEKALTHLVGDFFTRIRGELFKRKEFYLTLMDKENLSSLILEHDPLLYFSFLKGMDPNYGGLALTE